MLKQEVQERTDCPEMDIFIKSFSDDLNESQKFKLIDHISDCSACLDKFDLVEQIFKNSKKMALGKKKISLNKIEVEELKELSKRKILELEEQYRKVKKGIKSKPRIPVLSFPKIPLKYISMAAVLAVVILSSILIFRSSSEISDNTLRGEKEKNFQLLAPMGETKKIPQIFKWNPYPNTDRYEVQLMDTELVKIWNSEKTADTYIKLPSDLYQKIKPGTLYYWKVIAYLKDDIIKKSSLAEFELKPN